MYPLSWDSCDGMDDHIPHILSLDHGTYGDGSITMPLLLDGCMKMNMYEHPFGGFHNGGSPNGWCISWKFPLKKGSLPDLRNLLRNPVGFDLALHQSLPDLLRNLLWNPVELALEPC